MRLHNLKVIINSESQSDYNGQEGYILSYKFDSMANMVFLVRLGGVFETFLHDELLIHPDEVEDWNKEEERMKRYREAHPDY